MSILIDSIVKQQVGTEINGSWWVAKALNYGKDYTTFITKVKWALEVIAGKAIAVHFKIDEV